MTIRSVYGRQLEDFVASESYEHPWEVTVSDGMVALFEASFLDATTVFTSAPRARALGLADRPLHPMLCLNLALSFSVHDVSEQAIAHLAYIDVRYPDAGYVGDTVSARSTVLGVKPASSGDRGVVHVRTVLSTEKGRVICAFERKALIRGGKVSNRPASAALPHGPDPAVASLPFGPTLRTGEMPPARFGRRFGDFSTGQLYVHETGKTIGESEHMQLTALVRNSHPLHFDEVYCKTNSFAKQRVVYGGLVLGWVLALTSRDVAGNALWDLGLKDGAHPNGTVAGDTLYAASRVLSVEDRGDFGAVTFRIVGVKNTTAADALAKYGEALFTEELNKKDGKITEKVVEITRTLAVCK
jgi:2-methylfumaryl-CoA hydratase